MVEPKYSGQKIGQILLDKNLITKEQLLEALNIQKQTGKKLGEVLVEKGFVSEDVFVELLSYQKGFEFIDLASEQEKVDPVASNLVSREFASKRYVFPFNMNDNTLHVAMRNPLDINAIDEIRLITGYNVKPFVSTQKGIENAIRMYMSDDYSLKEIEEITKDQDLTVAERFREDIVEKNPLVKLANQIILKAISLGASDIHVEPQEKNCSIRFRIDGVLQKIKDVPKTVQRLLISRYKIMGGMDITESRLPQDGRSTFNFQNRMVDLRFASIPTVFGENITMRILNRDESMFDIEKLGMSKEKAKLYLKLISIPYGAVIITGPTGSGKTTTLYASLSKIANPEKKIYTIEDPVEYRFPQIMQIQVHHKIGMDFSRGLRAMMRSDPDIIMVGEMRDLETAKMAMEAAITGHLVLTTLHTNDAPSTLARLLEMGTESYMISSAVKCIVAQRLIRKLCNFCKKEIDASNIPIDDSIKPILEGKKIYTKVGCSRCNNTGYSGRVGIFSIMVISPKIRDMILKVKGTSEIENVAKEEGMKTLLESAAEKVAEGITSIEEMYRIIF